MASDGPRSAIVFFDNGEDLDDAALNEKLASGINKIMQNVQHLREQTRNELACLAVFEGTPSAIRALKEYVEKEKLGDLELNADKPAFIASPIIPAFTPGVVSAKNQSFFQRIKRQLGGS